MEIWHKGLKPPELSGKELREEGTTPRPEAKKTP